MYAVVRTGGKQYKVSPGDLVRVEKIRGDLGAQVELGPPLLLVTDEQASVGRPVLEGVAVTAEIVAQERAKKILVFKAKRRKGYRRKKGHRQYVTTLRIKEIRES